MPQTCKIRPTKAETNPRPGKSLLNPQIVESSTLFEFGAMTAILAYRSIRPKGKKTSCLAGGFSALYRVTSSAKKVIITIASPKALIIMAKMRHRVSLSSMG